MAFQAIDGVLCQKCQAEELTQIAALEKKWKSSKRKHTPNTTRYDDVIGVYMGLQDFAVTAKQEKRAEDKDCLSKEALQLQKLLLDFDILKSKYNGLIEVRKYLSGELSTLLNICGLGKGTLSKTKEHKKQILMSINMRCKKIMTFVIVVPPLIHHILTL